MENLEIKTCVANEPIASVRFLVPRHGGEFQ